MKRRHFLSKSLAGAGLAVSTPLVSEAASITKEAWPSLHNSGMLETIISIPNLKKDLNILQISDSHISCDNESDQEYVQYSARMNRAFQSIKHYKTGNPSTTTDNFKEILQLGIKEKVDLIALTGDIINYPSATAVNFVKSEMVACGIPYMYTAGNHDWHYEGMEGSADALRKYWCETRLKPLYTGGILYSSKIVNGVNLVMVDNSAYQVNEEQLAFFMQQKKRPEPMVLFVHIPLYMPSMPICCGHPEWGAATDNGYKIERREQWPASGNSKSTVEFVRQVMQSQNIVGVFAGHWHQYRTISNGMIQQHLALPALNGNYRMIRLKTLA
jgi:predicted phosphodiesterase